MQFGNRDETALHAKQMNIRKKSTRKRGNQLLQFQTPGSKNKSLLEAILSELKDARTGGGLFAWANSGGIRILLEDHAFEKYLNNGSFELVVGTDSITDQAAIDRLKLLTERHESFTASAFLSPSSSLFHPKMCWFETDEYLAVIVGSGNMTLGGLRSNWEAYVSIRMTGDEREQAKLEIDEILRSVGRNTRSLDDQMVTERVSQNSGNERTLQKIDHGENETDPFLDVASTVESVLIAEIPKSGDRWQQANFDKQNYELFFEAKVGSERRILLYNIDPSGEVGTVESRPSVQVASRNYRFELAAARGRSYPSTGSPLGVFLKIATGVFLYCLLMPDQAGYDEVSKLLAERWNGAQRAKRRAQCSAEDLKSAWPSSQFWKARVPAL